MKPTKNRIFCYGCKKSKMLFPTKEKADNFIAYNKEEILNETGKAPVRSYFCELCAGYHVTSNPSAEEGERMDLAIQRKWDSYMESRKDIDEIKRIQRLISERIENAKRALNFGLAGDAEDLIDICEIDLDDLKKLASSEVSVMKCSSKISVMRAKIEKVKEYMNFDESQILMALEDDSFRQSGITRINLVNILTVKRISKLLASINSHLENHDHIKAEPLPSQCRELINDFAGDGKNTMKEKYLDIVAELESRIKTSKERHRKKRGKSHKSHENTIQPVDSSQYKETILSIIERIELAVKAQEQRDMDSYETHIEIANYLIDELKVVDDNIKMLKNQLSKLTQ